MSFIIKRGDDYYVRAGNHGGEHQWSKVQAVAYHFGFRSVAEIGLERDPRLAGAEIIEVK